MNRQRSMELYEEIRKFDIDGGPSDFTFADRLAKENGWKRSFADRVIAEYRRFVFMAMAAGHPVTPSEAVDEAWHLHLLYTESYWDRMCKTVLGQPFHHGPTRGGKQEEAKFTDWYQKTLESYERIFGQKPRSDIWPSPVERFAIKTPLRQIDPRKFWLIPRRWIRRSAMAACMLAVLSVIAGCGTLLVGTQGTDTVVFIVIAGALGAGALVWVVGKIVQAGSSGRAGGSAGSCGGGAYTGTHIYGNGDSPHLRSHSHGDGSGHGCDGGHGGTDAGGGGGNGGGGGGGGDGGGGGGCGGGGCGGGGCGGS